MKLSSNNFPVVPQIQIVPLLNKLEPKILQFCAVSTSNLVFTRVYDVLYAENNFKTNFHGFFE